MKISAICLAATAVMTLAVGCEKDEPQVPIPAETGTTARGDDAVLVVYSRSGGVAGFNELLGVNDDGTATLELGEGEMKSSTGFELTDAELQRLRDALRAAALEPGSAPETGCNDCFRYEITVDGQRTSFDETQVPKGAVDLVAVLEQLVEDHIPAQASG